MTKQYKFVNWVNGMKINKNHFIQEQNAVIYSQMILIKSLITQYSFGIYRVSEEDGLILEKSINNNICHLEIKKLNGITANGNILQIDSSISFDIKMPEIENENIERKEFYVILKSNPFEKVVAGPIPEYESPPRYPFVESEISAYIIPQEQEIANDVFSELLIIDKIIFKDGKFEFDNKYIAPSFRMSSNKNLIDLVNKIFSQLKNIQEYIFQINNKIISDSSHTNIAKTTNHLLNNIIYPIELVITELKIQKYEIPVVQLVSGIMNIAMRYNNLLRICSPKDKEEYINYMSSWINLSTGEYESILDKFKTHKYNHNRIDESIQLIFDFLDLHELLLSKISGLSFIGKKKDTNIFVKEHKSNHNFLLD